MKKAKIAALLLACIMVFSGCALVIPNDEKIGNQVVATVNGVEIYRYEVDEMVDYYAAMYGVDLESEDETMAGYKVMLQSSVLDSLVTNEVLLQKAPELGITLSDEQLQSNKEQADAIFESRKDDIRAAVEEEAKIDSSIDVDAEVERRYQEFLDEEDSTPESYLEFLNESSIVSDVQTYMYSTATLSDEDVRAWYDDTLEVQKDEMTNNPEALDAYVTQRNIYTFIPEDTVAVKQVLLAFKDEEKVAEATTLYSEGKVDEMMELLAPDIEELMPTALEVKQKLEDGEDLDAVIAEYGEDPDMVTDPRMIYGYLVGESTNQYLTEFSQAALGLMNVGDVSEPVVTYYGIHVLQSIKVYKAGVIPFKEVEEEIRAALLPAEEDAAFEVLRVQWESEADIVYFRDRLD